MYLQNEDKIWVAKAQDERIYLLPQMANRHGVISGATGTGKTVTLKVLAEAFSDMGVPVFLADIKGDVSGMCKAGQSNKNVDERVEKLGVENFTYKAFPVRFFDVFGQKGIPVRAMVSGMGPELLARILGLNDTQTGVLYIIFKIADDQGLLLIDLKDLKAMLQHVVENKDQYQTTYGNVTAASVGSIQRAILTLEANGGDIFFGEPELDIKDWIAQDDLGHGIINLLYCVELVKSPLLYSTFLLWMLAELYETLPEVGDLAKPKMVFFFDEAHLLFNDAPKALVQKIEQVARLIRSKGVGIYFITQSPSDIPDTVLAQLGNKIQHALRAYTPKEQKAIKAAAESFRTNPAFDTETVLTELGTGEALVSFLDEKGAPSIVQRAFILPPQSFMGVAEDDLIEQRVRGSALYAKYGTAVDGQSAYEDLQTKNAEIAQQKQAEETAKQQAKEQEAAEKAKQKEEEKLAKEQQKAAEKAEKERQKQINSITKSVGRVVTNTASSVGRQIGTQVIRSLFGNKK